MKSEYGAGVFLVVLLLMASTIQGIASPNCEIGRKYFLKHNLIYSAGPPRVYPKWITFPREGWACDEILWDKTVGRGTEVTIAGMSRKGTFESVTFTVGGMEFEILVNHSSRRRFKISYANIFSSVLVPEESEDCQMKTKGDLIRCLGYPIYSCKNKGRIFFYYNLGFIGHRIQGYHDAWFELKRDNVIGCGGLI